MPCRTTLPRLKPYVLKRLNHALRRTERQRWQPEVRRYRDKYPI
jgi:hypothetical protein